MVLRKTNRWRQFSRGTNTPIIASSTKRPKLPLPGGSNRFATQVRGASKTIPLACEAAAHSVHPGQLFFCRLVRLDLDRLAQSDRVLWVYCSTTCLCEVV